MTRVMHVQKVSGISGSEAHLLSLLPALREWGWEARMVMLPEGEPGARDFETALSERGVPVEPLRLRRDLDPRALVRLFDVVRRARPAILHTHLIHADLFGLPIAALARVPVRISTKHGFNVFRERRAIAVADRAIAALAHRHIAISAGLADYLSVTEGLARERFEVVHYGIEPGPEPGPYDGEELRLLAVGRLVPIKGFDVLLRAFAATRARVPGLLLEIAGDGPLRAELERQAGAGVTFLGRLDGVSQAYERAAAVVVPSRGEGFGMVALEAMERGRAVVASRVGGLPELVVPGETGMLVRPEDPAALSSALVELAGDLDLVRRLGANGRARALERFSVERCVQRTVAIYEGALRASRWSSAAPASTASTKSHETR
jgi:glycosyltransferase involved in cell wall biosynthesis